MLCQYGVAGCLDCWEKLGWVVSASIIHREAEVAGLRAGCRCYCQSGAGDGGHRHQSWAGGGRRERRRRCG